MHYDPAIWTQRNTLPERSTPTTADESLPAVASAYFLNDIRFPAMSQADRQLIPKEMKQNKLLLPCMLYSYLFNTFAPPHPTDDALYFVYDAAPTFCAGLVPALEIGFWYTVATQNPISETHIKVLVEFILKSFADEAIQHILDDFAGKARQLQVETPKRTSGNRVRQATYN